MPGAVLLGPTGVSVGLVGVRSILARWDPRFCAGLEPDGPDQAINGYQKTESKQSFPRGRFNPDVIHTRQTSMDWPGQPRRDARRSTPLS